MLAVMPSGLVVLDISVTHPAADSYVQAAAARAGAAADARDAHKRQKYAAITLHGATTFVPLTVESYGRLVKAAMGFFNEPATAAVQGRSHQGGGHERAPPGTQCCPLSG